MDNPTVRDYIARGNVFVVNSLSYYVGRLHRHCWRFDLDEGLSVGELHECRNSSEIRWSHVDFVVLCVYSYAVEQSGGESFVDVYVELFEVTGQYRSGRADVPDISIENFLFRNAVMVNNNPHVFIVRKWIVRARGGRVDQGEHVVVARVHFVNVDEVNT